MDPKQALIEKRKEIDTIDEQLMKLISQRAEIALKVGEIKRQAESNPTYYRPEREAQILKVIMGDNPGPLADPVMAGIFRTIMSSCLALQQPLKVAFLGPEGTFSNEAVIKQFGPNASLVPVDSIQQVFDAVEYHDAEYGVVPIENSIEGIVNPTLDALIHSGLYIISEVHLPIQQNLLVDANDKNEITRIYSHQQSLAQCRQWLNANYPNAQKIAVSSNAYAAKLAKKEPGAAAIASEIAASLYDLIVKNPHIQDNPSNTTRFLVLGKKAVEPSGDDKTSMLIYTANEPGALERILHPLTKHNINLTLLLPRPYLHEMWNYIFFLECEGHQDHAELQAALDELKAMPLMLSIKGSYPKAVL